MEKRRRARINHSLSVLKGLIVKDEVRHPISFAITQRDIFNERYFKMRTQMTSSQNATSQSRLEKADILELTVMHVRALEKEKAEYQQRRLSEPADNKDNERISDVRSYQLGYQACCQDVCRLVNDTTPDVTKERVLEYLSQQKQKQLGDGMDRTDVNITPTRLPDGRLAIVFSQGWIPGGSDVCPANASTVPASSYHLNPVPATPPSSPAQQVAAAAGGSAAVWRPWF